MLQKAKGSAVKLIMWLRIMFLLVRSLKISFTCANQIYVHIYFSCWLIASRLCQLQSLTTTTRRLGVRKKPAAKLQPPP